MPAPAASNAGFQVWERSSSDAAPGSVPRSVGEDVTRGRLVHGEARDVARALATEGLTGRVDLVYIDPPFASQADYVHEARLDGPATGRVVRTPAYSDTWRGEPRGGAAAAAAFAGGARDGGIAAYLEGMSGALEALVPLLSRRGTIWVHLDWRASYLVRVLLDELLGRDAFLNEIVWRRAPNLGRQATSYQFGRTLDTLVVYGKPDATLVPPTRLEPIEKNAIRWDEQGRPFTSAPRGDYTDESIARLDKEGRIHRTSSGRVYIKYFLVKDGDGVLCRERRVDALWTDVPPLRHVAVSERTGFPTQKPRALLERIIACATPPDGLVVDVFCGSGTTAEAAHVLGRRFIAGDAGSMAIATARARLLRAHVPLVIERCGLSTIEEGDLPEIVVRAHGEDAIAIELVSPVEPLAWCVDAAHDPAAPFAITWSGERAPGARPIPAAREAVVRYRAGASIAVRVYGDDGRVATRVFTDVAVASSIASSARVVAAAASGAAAPPASSSLRLPLPGAPA